MSMLAFITFLVTQMIGIRRSQVKTLAVLAFALFHTEALSVAAIGKGIQSMVADKHNIKRVDRFLGNDRLNVLAMAGALLRMICNEIKPGSRLLVAMDWTDLHDDRHQTLMLALIVGSRAIPIYWSTVVKAETKDQMTKKEIELLKAFKTIVPEGYKIIILADRGFAKTELFKTITELRFDYVIRLPRSGAYIFSEHYNGPMRDLPIGWKGQIDLGISKYTTKNLYSLRVVALFDVFQKEPWVLSTSLKEPLHEVAYYYGRRFEIEECFRDIKNERSGLCLRGTKLSTPARFDRLFLVISCGYLFMVVTGKWAEERELHRAMMANTVKCRTLGLWRVGRNILSRPEKYPFILEVSPAELFGQIGKLVLVA